ncbi:hypothetical protein AJ80_09342 [Polytolypa hystricis UAMH7299]|uniref:Mediator of RNA polymerase II transcription subunit 31 n=1 Tax=Polytolypa hystricis (strain UAMH7299) TaxID=1447883 RepID=A0A2B7WS88_POLH7|nr:hypothetical protein AJ80_09342 [Polytolypa hystricis UAMH7299]
MNMAQNTTQPPPPDLSNPRFTLELEFVLSLANPHYISHLAVSYPHLLGVSSAAGSASTSRNGGDASSSSDAQAFAAYLAYLYSYWKRPEYAQFLTHPGATLRALRLLQEESFRQAVIRPQVIEALLGAGTNENVPSGEAEGENDKSAPPDADMTGDVQPGEETRNGAMT